MEEIEFEAALKEYLNYKKLFVRNNTYEWQEFKNKYNLYTKKFILLFNILKHHKYNKYIMY